MPFCIRLTLGLFSVGALFFYATVVRGHELGIYATADRVFRFLLLAAGHVISVTNPIFFRADSAGAPTGRMIAGYLGVIAGLGLVGAALGTWLAPPFVQALLGPEYHAASDSMVLLLWAVPAWLLESICLTQLLILARREGWTLGVCLATAASFLTLVVCGGATNHHDLARITILTELIAAVMGMLAVGIAFCRTIREVR